MQPQMPARTPEVFDYLKQCASDMRTVNYGEVADEVGLMAPGLGDQLSYIRDECRDAQMPWLNAIVVNKETWRPSEGFMPDDMEIADGDDFELFWRGMVLQVFATDWSDVNL